MQLLCILEYAFDKKELSCSSKTGSKQFFDTKHKVQEKRGISAQLAPMTHLGPDLDLSANSPCYICLITYFIQCENKLYPCKVYIQYFANTLEKGTMKKKLTDLFQFVIFVL